MQMPVERVKADQRVEADRGRVALMRGPLVYCLESADNGGRVRDLYPPDDAGLTAEHRPDLLGGITVLRASGRRAQNGSADAPAHLLKPLGHRIRLKKGAIHALRRSAENPMKANGISS